MEKTTPHYDLSVVKEEVVRSGPRAFTRSALQTGKGMGLTLRDMEHVICALEPRMLYKSMISYADHRN